MESSVWVSKSLFGGNQHVYDSRSTRILSSRAYLALGLLFSFLSVSSLSLLGQSATGSISGTVADSSGAVIPKATVVLTDEATKGKRDKRIEQLLAFSIFRQSTLERIH